MPTVEEFCSSGPIAGRCRLVTSALPAFCNFVFIYTEEVMKKLAVILASLVVVACASSLKTSQSKINSTNENNTSSSAGMDLSRLTADMQKLEQQSDYFDYNKFTVKPEYQAVIQKEAEFIKSHKQDSVTLQGNADERGSNQYNLDLGNKRAFAVAKGLEVLGVPATQIKVVSLGEEKPRLTCHREQCWKENRRVDFVHQLN
jgi:peptidoglycan-associated lipoprotein